ncbi:PKD domain-containing protein [Moritella sp. 36]|uniref:PKD domain-containing protein n=1 Tax=Moritella sp. 36 TaxID=2746233 RepID=UPI00210494D9|nr:hypothetical protein [Moritella sp. 36]
MITVADLTLSEINLTAPDIADGMKEKFTFKVTMTGDNGVATTTTSFYAYDSNYVAPLQVEIPAVPDTTTGEVITLTANSIINGNGKNIRYTWLQTDGPSVTLVNPKLQTVKFTAPPVSKKSKIKFKVTAEDDKGNVTVETTSISIKPLNKPSSDDGSGGSFGIFGTLSLLGLGLLRRKAK